MMTEAASQLRPPRPVYTRDAIYPLMVGQYHEMIRAGILSDDDPVELVEELLLFRMRKTPPHSVCTGRIYQLIRPLLRSGHHFETHQPVTLADGEPEPDGAVVRGEIDDYMTRHPHADEVPLIIEISDATLDRDRGIKLRSYARAQIAEYWIVNLIDGHVEVYTDPDAQVPGSLMYRNRAVHAPGDCVPLVIAGQRLATVPVSEMLP